MHTQLFAIIAAQHPPDADPAISEARAAWRYFTGNRAAINRAISVAAGGSIFASTTTT